MKVIYKKRLLYENLLTGEILLGGEEYDDNLTNDNILGAMFELGKHEWHPNFCALYQYNNEGQRQYLIRIFRKAYHQKSWYNSLSEWFCKILRK